MIWNRTNPRVQSHERVPAQECPSTYDVRIDDKTLRFSCPNKIAFDRARYLLEKEPGTISWINSFAQGSVFWDVGANLGVYSLYAGVMRACRVLAFEPGSANYFGLNNNILLNNLDERVKAFPIAIDRRCRIDTMRMRDNAIGTALHTFGEARDYKGDMFEPAWLQGSVAISIDMLIEHFHAPPPNHIKIDVDGLEVAVVEGGTKTFKNPHLESVLIEVDLNDAQEVNAIASVLENCGFVRDDSVVGNDVRSLEGAKIYNLIYRRR